MWTSHFPDGEADEDFHRRMSAPENELPVVLPQNLLLARTDDVAVALTRLQVFTTGVSFELVVRMRPSARTALGVSVGDLVWRHGPGRGGFLLGLEFSDGRRVSTVPDLTERPDVVFANGGGSGGQTSVEQSWWLNPLPPDGPLRFVVRCDELGVPETVVELDGSSVRRAAQDVVVLWPWEPPADSGPELPPPPPVPADSWFAPRP